MRTGWAWLAVAMSVVVLLALPQFGWCWGQYRFLSRQEMVGAAIDEALGGRRVRVETVMHGERRFAFHDAEPYASRAAFLVANPACCRIAPAVGDQGSFVPWPERWCGWIPHNVRMVYAARYRDDVGRVRAVEVTDNVPVTSCGRVAR